jgi:hypothetical protein
MVKGFGLNPYLLQTELNTASFKCASDIGHTTCGDVSIREVRW